MLLKKKSKSKLNLLVFSTNSNEPKNPNTHVQHRRLPPLITQTIPENDPSVPKPSPADELQLGNIDKESRNPEELQQTILLLESKLVSLTNINCALQSQIDEISGTFNRLKLETDDIKTRLAEAMQEAESLKSKGNQKVIKKEKK